MSCYSYIQLYSFSDSERRRILPDRGNRVREGDNNGRQGCCNILLKCLDCNDDNDNNTRSCFDVVLDLLFYLFCFLSGQLMLDFVKSTSKTKHRIGFFVMTILELPFFILFLFLNAGVLVFNFYAIFGHFPNSTMARGYISGPYEIKETELTSLSNSHMVDINAHYTQQFKVMLEVVFTMSTLSGSLSYIIMTYILVTHYSFLHIYYERFKTWLSNKIKWLRPYKGAGPYKGKPILNPFPLSSRAPDENGHEKYYKKVLLCPPQNYCFYFIFLLNMILFAANVGVPFRILDIQDHIQNSHNKTDIYKTYEGQRDIDYVGFVTLLSSQYCAIISCFIFSKVAYAVTIECSGKMDDFTRPWNNGIVPTPQQVLERLQDDDKDFYELSTWSMRPYRFWFAVHWFFYAVTAFLSIAFLAEIIVHKLYGGRGSQCNSVCDWVIGYLFLFTLEHTVLFLYPCFRAASILAARNSLIKRVCNEDIPNIPTKLKAVFVQYMKERKCGFELSILCARIEFGFNIAYISIFLGLLGIVIKLSL